MTPRIIIYLLTFGSIGQIRFTVDCLSLNGKTIHHNTGRNTKRFSFTSPIFLGYLHNQKYSNLYLSGSDSQSELKDDDGLTSFRLSLSQSRLPLSAQTKIIDAVQRTGWVSSEELLHFAADFEDRPEVLSQVLQNDFNLQPLTSHQIRAALINFLKFNRQQDDHHIILSNEDNHAINLEPINNLTPISNVDNNNNNGFPKISTEDVIQDKGDDLKIPFKSFVVNDKAKSRFQNKDNYGLPKDFSNMYPVLSKEITIDFLNFMIKPIAAAQESPIREATATVYVRHARLFLGWYLNHEERKTQKNISLVDIIPNAEATSVQPIIDFILWLRKERDISESYETNLFRGLSKLLKYRFVKESRADPSYGEKSYQDIAAVREMRRLHKDAQIRQKNSPRSSQEERKWISWDEYLNVVQNLKKKVQGNLSLNAQKGGKIPLSTKRRIATEYQYYLILAFMACVPDRQRTFRELVVGKTFIRDDNLQCWTICHGPEDYKTGKTYGQRPPLILSADLTEAIDDYLLNWRPFLLKATEQNVEDTFFLQARTGKAMTSDSIYNIVSRCCFKQTGKKTNPHLLRDMIVTHVRSSPNTSEQQLEALALYMGHSVEMQRNSYDRRTMEQKVAPAVELLQSVNKSQ